MLTVSKKHGNKKKHYSLNYNNVCFYMRVSVIYTSGNYLVVRGLNLVIINNSEIDNM